MIRSFIARQLGYPSGFFGRLVMRLLNRSNAVMNDVVVTQLSLQPQDELLEIGFGGGYLLAKIIASEIPKLVVGIDPQVDVIRLGQRKFKFALERGIVKLEQACGENIPYGDRSFDKICTVNTIYFWTDPIRVLSECYRTLKPNSKLVICYNSAAFIERQKLTQHGFKTYSPAKLERLMEDTGFVELNTISAEGGTGNDLFYCTVGTAQKK